MPSRVNHYTVVNRMRNLCERTMLSSRDAGGLVSNHRTFFTLILRKIEFSSQQDEGAIPFAQAGNTKDDQDCIPVPERQWKLTAGRMMRHRQCHSPSLFISPPYWNSTSPRLGGVSSGTGTHPTAPSHLADLGAQSGDRSSRNFDRMIGRNMYLHPVRKMTIAAE